MRNKNVINVKFHSDWRTETFHSLQGRKLRPEVDIVPIKYFDRCKYDFDIRLKM